MGSKENKIFLSFSAKKKEVERALSSKPWLTGGGGRASEFKVRLRINEKPDWAS